MALAKQQGKYKGRKKSIDTEAIRLAMKEEGASFRKVAEKLNVSLSTVQRALKHKE
ncbi:helix-turn-helix domain-containing protein [Acinetobacter nectaris]|uniref:helix-turn-helix domain-containing protein n=1 Tax=Acinetobacter nectaris TaxID=1219382 RepID=UPI0030171B62